MYIRPDKTPPVIEALLLDCEDVDVLLNTLQNYLQSFPQIDHFNNPLDYVDATFYKNKVKDFYEILIHERERY